MQDISTISEFLLQAGTQYCVYDLSRGIRPLSTQQFLDIEAAQIPHPFPRQQHGWFALLFNNKQLSGQHYIWFVKLPLDELGKVIDAGRLEFLQIIITALGQQLENAEKANGQLPDNPYSFVPSQQQMADFNSLSRKSLGLAPSQHHAAAQAYFSNPQQQDWQQLALQGISDFVVFSSQTMLTNIMNEQLTHLPTQVVVSLFSSLENQTLNKTVTIAIIDWAKKHNNDNRQVALALRALSLSTAETVVSQFISQLLSDQQQTPLELLIVIAGRHWQKLEQDSLLLPFFEQLANANVDEPVFAPLFADLAQIPSLRERVLAILRLPEKSAALADAIGQLFEQRT
ncbi:DUF3549 family protein [Neptunicella sp. SCSIO 80796]|uniref:DUF3549 family protein n=1 Tax=Neptunicella plasticusilytica TaxID=3117012 RepID=UPI003A4D9E0B